MIIDNYKINRLFYTFKPNSLFIECISCNNSILYSIICCLHANRTKYDDLLHLYLGIKKINKLREISL